jgi:hypothetical protein
MDDSEILENIKKHLKIYYFNGHCFGLELIFILEFKRLS